MQDSTILCPGKIHEYLYATLQYSVLCVQGYPDAGGVVVQGRGGSRPGRRQHPATGGHPDPQDWGCGGGTRRGDLQVTYSWVGGSIRIAADTPEACLIVPDFATYV